MNFSRILISNLFQFFEYLFLQSSVILFFLLFAKNDEKSATSFIITIIIIFYFNSIALGPSSPYMNIEEKKIYFNT